MEVMGYPIYSGSNTLCTATAVLETGIVPKQEGIQRFKLEAPAGLVQIEARVHNGVVESVTCEGLPSYIDTYRDTIQVPGIGEVTYSVAYSGGFYALVDAEALGFKLVRDEEQALAACAYKIVEAIKAQRGFSHYTLVLTLRFRSNQGFLKCKFSSDLSRRPSRSTCRRTQPSLTSKRRSRMLSSSPSTFRCW